MVFETKDIAGLEALGEEQLSFLIDFLLNAGEINQKTLKNQKEMLFELTNVAQNEASVFRRCFEDNYFDLTVWYNNNRQVIGFQLSYERFGDERVLTWKIDSGYEHEKADDSRVALSIPAVTMLVADGIFPYEYVLKKFKERATEIDQDIAQLVIDKIIEYGDSLKSVVV